MKKLIPTLTIGLMLSSLHSAGKPKTIPMVNTGVISKSQLLQLLAHTK